MLSILHDPRLVYPDARDAFDPHERYPEYRGGVSSAPNPIYEAVRRVLQQAGLDRTRWGTPQWNPLGELVPSGASVFVLCNFVYHRRGVESVEDFHGKCTHGSVLRALVDYLLLAVGPNGRVRFGNAPLQGCRWESVLEDTGAAAVEARYRKLGLPVQSIDLRQLVTERGPLGDVQRRVDRGGDDTVAVDLGRDSLLDDLPPATGGSGPRFRVSDYDPDRTEGCHASGAHVYLLHRAVLESDVLVSLPKLKTHEKVGVTCAMKGFVGAVAQKDCLAHHRYGPPRAGGDEYAGSLAFLEPLSALSDWVQRRRPDAPLRNLWLIGDRTARRALVRLGVTPPGAWHGNDTCWRMSLDLSRLVHHADRQGRLQEAPCRRQLVLVDGVVAGEGDGPLVPRGVRAGTLLLGDDVAVVDRAACRLMGFPPERIALVRGAFQRMRYPVTACAADEESPVVLNGELVGDRDLSPVLGRPFAPPRGWREYLPRTA